MIWCHDMKMMVTSSGFIFVHSFSCLRTKITKFGTAKMAMHTRKRVRLDSAMILRSRERRPEHRTRNGTGTERERTGTRTREMLVQHLRHSRLPSAFLAAGKTQLGLHKDHLLCGRSICILSRPQNASRISFPFSYLDAWFHFCLTSDLSAFCYGHKMQLGTLACGK